VLDSIILSPGIVMPRKIIVAVHGIGDQVRYETIQTVANAFCRYQGLLMVGSHRIVRHSGHLAALYPLV
jgi:hypothetical protein